MAFDGFVISNIVNELNEKILNRLSFEPGQTEPDTGPQLLYAASEASGQRAYHLRRTAGL